MSASFLAQGFLPSPPSATEQVVCYSSRQKPLQTMEISRQQHGCAGWSIAVSWTAMWCERQHPSELKSHRAMGQGLPGVRWWGDTFPQCKLCLCLPAVAEKEYLWGHLGRAEKQAKQWQGTTMNTASLQSCKTCLGFLFLFLYLDNIYTHMYKNIYAYFFFPFLFFTISCDLQNRTAK